MCSCYHLIVLFLTIPNLAISGPASNPEISSQPNTLNQQQQQQKINELQNIQLNTLNAYAANYEAIASKQAQDDKFKPSYKLPEMETNFMPIRSSVAPELVSTIGSHAPVLMQYLPQTINESGVQYLQLIPTRPLVVPIGPYLAGNTGVQPLTYDQHLTPSNSIDFTTRPLLSPLAVNMAPRAPSPLVNVSPTPLPPYGIQSYAGGISPYKQNQRINRETKDKQLLGPISLNINEYIPPGNIEQHTNFGISGRP